jgi:mannonate dehydratase
MSIRIATGQFNQLSPEHLRFAKQIGASGIQMNTPKLPGDARWEQDDVAALVKQVKEAGLTFEAIENVPVHFYHKAMLGLPGRDEQIENYQHTIRAVGRGGVPVLGYHFMPNSVWRTERSSPGRGGARCSKFDMETVDGFENVEDLRQFLPKVLGKREMMPLIPRDQEPISEEAMWQHYQYFIEAVLPVAEEEGLTLALHPDDPPVPMLGGVARLFYKPENFVRAFEIAGESPAFGLDLCFGCCSEMAGGAENVRRMVEYFGPRGRITYVHFRDVMGTVPNFQECFLGEGNFDPAEAMLWLVDNGFDGFLLDDHVPVMDDDSDWAHRGRSHAIGYMQGLLRMQKYNASTPLQLQP